MGVGLFFNPRGRIGPSAFLFAASVLIVIGALFTLAPLLGQTGLLLSSLSILLLYPWLVIWVKRFHDADKSGWLFLLALALWFGASYAAGLFAAQLMGAPAPTVASTTDAAVLMAAVSEQQRTLAIPNTVAGALVSLLVVVIANGLLKSDPKSNPYGPAGAA